MSIFTKINVFQHMCNNHNLKFHNYLKFFFITIDIYIKIYYHKTNFYNFVFKNMGILTFKITHFFYYFVLYTKKHINRYIIYMFSKNIIF